MSRKIPPPGRLVPVDDTSVHVMVEGKGSPTVVLEAGIAASSLSWAGIQREVAQFTTVMSHDRPGFGWSGAAPSDATALTAAEGLRQVLDAIDLPAPYVLVGHSFGGLIARLFQQRYPGLVCGMVLVDPVIRDEWRDPTPERRITLARGVTLSRRGALLARMGVVGFALRLLTSGATGIPQLMARLSAGKAAGVAGQLAGEVRKMPEEHWPAIAMHWSQARSFRTMADNLEKLPLSAAQLDEKKPIGDIPVIVLSAKPTPEHARDASLSTRGENILVDGAGHWIQLDRPETVVDAVRRVCAAR